MIKKLLKNVETTKRILRMCMILVFVVTVSDIIYSYIYAQSDVVTCLTDNAFKLSFIAVGFYTWKAKCENIKKYGKENTPDDWRYRHFTS